MAQPAQPQADHPSGAHGGHGNSVAAWSGVGVIMLGFLIACIGAAATSIWLIIVGLAVAAIGGPLVWRMLAAMGFGPQPHGEGT